MSPIGHLAVGLAAKRVTPKTPLAILLFLLLPGMMIWYFVLARRFFQMARGN
jgi:hypothetical protein